MLSCPAFMSCFHVLLRNGHSLNSTLERLTLIAGLLLELLVLFCEFLGDVAVTSSASGRVDVLVSLDIVVPALLCVFSALIYDPSGAFRTHLQARRQPICAAFPF